MPLEIGTWTLDASGIVGQLNIQSVDSNGTVNGGLSTAGLAPFSILGFWDEQAQKIVFQVFPPVPGPNVVGAIQVYTGFMFTDPLRLSQTAGDAVFTLAGTFQVLPTAGQASFVTGTAGKSEFGWYAQIGVN